MIMKLLLLKAKIKYIFEKHNSIAMGVLRFIVSLCTFLIITRRFGYSSFLGNIYLILLFSLICAVLPNIVSIGIVFVYILGEIAAFSPILSLVCLVASCIFYLAFGRLTHNHKQTYVLLAIPIMASISLESVVPIVAALFVGPEILPGIIFGVILQYLFSGVTEYSIAIGGKIAVNDKSYEVLGGIQYLANYVMRNKLLLVTIAALIITFICVYYIRRSKAVNAPQIGILVGGVVYISIGLVTNIVLNNGDNILGLVWPGIAAMAIAIVIQFFKMTLDYHGTRNLQFEDDEYFYYVTAIPKYKVTKEEKSIITIAKDTDEENIDLRGELQKAIEEEVSDNEHNS